MYLLEYLFNTYIVFDSLCSTVVSLCAVGRYSEAGISGYCGDIDVLVLQYIILYRAELLFFCLRSSEKGFWDLLFIKATQSGDRMGCNWLT